MMLALDFGGWFECRLATDPDPSDEPRGVSGWTFAVAGEPDLDRIIRAQPGNAVNRPLGPSVGVRVRAVSIGGDPQEKHPLLDAPVDLLDEPVFEGRNGLASEDTEEPIFPFHLSIDGGAVSLRREYRSLETGDWAFTRSLGVISGPEIIAGTGIGDPFAFRQQRKAALEEALAQSTDPTAKVAFRKRIRDIEVLSSGLPVVGMMVGLRYRYVLEGPWFEVRDPQGKLRGEVDGSPWVASFWMGGWDTDALCGFMKGRLAIPFTSR